MNAVALFCPECKRAAVKRATSEHIYQGRDRGPIWECPVCDCYVGCHPNGEPLGTLANKQLRNDRRAAHELFEPLVDDWRLTYPDATEHTQAIRGSMRTRAYRWLAHHMRIEFEDCHFAMFDSAQCAQAIRLISELRPTAATVREWWKAQSANGAARARAAAKI